MSTLPKWFRPVAIAALVWNLLGCMAYLADAMLTPEDIANMSEADQKMYASRTMLAVSASAFAVWFGAAGSLGLILRKKWALPVLILSMVGVIVQDIGILFMTDVPVGPIVFVLQGLVLIVSIGLVMLARKAIAQGWIPEQTVQQPSEAS